MCVPAHDDRDFEFARKFGLPIVQVIAKDGKEIENMTEAYTEANGIMINSGDWNGLESAVLKKEAPHMIEEKGFSLQEIINRPGPALIHVRIDAEEKVYPMVPPGAANTEMVGE